MYGRGGAGNINAAMQPSKQIVKDVEANRLAAIATPTAQSASPQPSNASQDYAHTGRGGAGNWYQPSELQKDGTFTTPSDATAAPTGSQPQVSTPWHPEGQEMPLARSGRGGAGNFLWKSEEQKQIEKQEEEKKKDMLREGVERDVEAGLMKPPGAVLGRGVERGW